MERLILTKQNDRSFCNPFENVSPSENPLDDKLKEKIRSYAENLLKEWETNVEQEVSSPGTLTDTSIYTGIAGYALLYLEMGRLLNNDQYIEKAFFLSEKCVAHVKKRKRSTFLTGDAGPLSVITVCSHLLKQQEKEQHYIHRLEKMFHSNVLTDGDLPDELLYGRAGCLYSLLYVKECVREKIDEHLIASISKAIIHSGMKLSGELKKQGYQVPPLMFEWHGSKYLAAAHGMAGIFYLLFKAREYLDLDTLQNYIRPSLDFLLEVRFAGGNFPSSLGNDKRDRLVQWCHGAPGFVHCLVEASKVYGSDVYLTAAKKCADVIWNRGVLTKGFGLCHGIAGNAYAFLYLYQHTGDATYLHRAVKFAEIITDASADQFRVPDHPLSLYEGTAGVIHFLFSLLQPPKASFPGYQLL